MSDINTYANDLLLEFLMTPPTNKSSAMLQQEFGDDWIRERVERHLNQGALRRVLARCSSRQ